jgi:hypothetical protein
MAAPIVKRRPYRPADRAAPYGGSDPLAASRRLAETEAAERRAKEHPEVEKTY